MSKLVNSLSIGGAVAICILGARLSMAAPGAMTFTSPQKAVDSLVDALRKDDVLTLKAILGADGDAILESGDATADQNARQAFLDAYDAHNDLAKTDAKHYTVNVGEDEWPMPIPIVKKGVGWQFDTAAGKKEMLARRIGRNELYTIQSALAFVDAQREYAAQDRGDGVLDYAQKFVSTPGKKDGLYWETKPGEPDSPLGPLFASARAEGYEKNANGPTAYHGYYYKILDGQSANASGGAYDYVVNGKMIGGFALVAYPAQYGNSGVTTFIVNQDGVVFQKDLGPNTAQIVNGMRRFDPGKGWTKA